MIYYTARHLRKSSWRFEDGWDTEAKAQRAAKFYRREYRRRCVVVAVPEGLNRVTILKKQLASTT